MIEIERLVAQSRSINAVVVLALVRMPAPLIMGVSCERVTTLGKSDICATALSCDVGRSRVTRNRARPLGERATHAPWCDTLNDVVVPACAAEGHVTVARPRSTTLSARHQVENRWNMLLQATWGHVVTRTPTTLHSQ